MPDTIQVVRVTDIVAEGIAVWDDSDSVLLVYDGQDWLPVDVIELTEEQSNFPGGNSQGRRWVSRREPVDA